MSSKLNRREFMKLMALLPFFNLKGLPLESAPARRDADDPQRPNILILLFDTFAAQHASIYGYPRATTPNLARFAERATVYHAHHSTGNFTNPGTASLLTGTYPWTNQAYQLYGPVVEPYDRRSIFSAFEPGNYYRLGYSHNLVATALLYQFLDDMDLFKKTRELCLLDDQVSDKLFFNDYDVALWRERVFRGEKERPTLPTSFLFFLASVERWQWKLNKLNRTYAEQFPRGLPRLHEQVFRLEDTVDWLRDNLPHLPQPYLAYFHVLPPHDPYNARSEFIGRFNDGWVPEPKPEHHFSEGLTEAELDEYRVHYDEFIAYTDAEFGRLYDALDAAGELDNTYLIVTSDHGELFERGIWMHLTRTLYDGVVRVPLLIHKPGQQERVDVTAPTSSIDLLPSLLHAAGLPIPDWCEGTLLPTFGDANQATDRPVYVVEAKTNPKHRPLTQVTLALVRGQYKLIGYYYPDYNGVYELYDLHNDPEERQDLYATQPDIAADMRAEMDAKLEEVNARYRS